MSLTKSVSRSISHIVSLLSRGEKDLTHLYSDTFSAIFDKCDSIEDEYEWIHELSLKCEDRVIVDPDWLLVAGRVKSSYLTSITPDKYSKTTELMGRLLDPGYSNFVSTYADQLDEMIVHDRDYGYSNAGISTLMKSYLMRLKERVNKKKSPKSTTEKDQKKEEKIKETSCRSACDLTGGRRP